MGDETGLMASQQVPSGCHYPPRTEDGKPMQHCGSQLLCLNACHMQGQATALLELVAHMLRPPPPQAKWDPSLLAQFHA